MSLGFPDALFKKRHYTQERPDGGTDAVVEITSRHPRLGTYGYPIKVICDIEAVAWRDYSLEPAMLFLNLNEDAYFDEDGHICDAPALAIEEGTS